jgi:hypothetical protein
MNEHIKHHHSDKMGISRDDFDALERVVAAKSGIHKSYVEYRGAAQNEAQQCESLDPSAAAAAALAIAAFANCQSSPAPHVTPQAAPAAAAPAAASSNPFAAAFASIAPCWNT